MREITAAIGVHHILPPFRTLWLIRVRHLHQRQPAEDFQNQVSDEDKGRAHFSNVKSELQRDRRTVGIITVMYRKMAICLCVRHIFQGLLNNKLLPSSPIDIKTTSPPAVV